MTDGIRFEDIQGAQPTHDCPVVLLMLSVADEKYATGQAQMEDGRQAKIASRTLTPVAAANEAFRAGEKLQLAGQRQVEEAKRHKEAGLMASALMEHCPKFGAEPEQTSRWQRLRQPSPTPRRCLNPDFVRLLEYPLAKQLLEQADWQHPGDESQSAAE